MRRPLLFMFISCVMLFFDHTTFAVEDNYIQKDDPSSGGTIDSQCLDLKEA